MGIEGILGRLGELLRDQFGEMGKWGRMEWEKKEGGVEPKKNKKKGGKREK